MTTEQLTEEQDREKTPPPAGDAQQPEPAPAARRTAWTPVVFQAGMAAVVIWLAVILEWLFQITKPSFLGAVPTFEVFAILVFTPLPLLLAFALPVALLRAGMTQVKERAGRLVLLTAVSGINTLLSASLIILIIDNFTYSISGIGISSSTGFLRIVYLVICAAMTVGVFVWYFVRDERVAASDVRTLKLLLPAAWALPLLAGIFWIIGGGTRQTPAPVAGLDARGADLPNILYIASDGLDADELSIYNPDAETTPFLASLGDRLIVAENAFANAPTSMKSDVSMFASQLPLETGVHYPPDIVQGPGVTLHMPGILRNAGYTSTYGGVRYYADPFDWNIVHGFDEVSGRSDAAQWHYALSRVFMPGSSSYFLQLMTDRVITRVQHVLGIIDLTSIIEGSDGANAARRDRMQVDAAKEFMRTRPEPFYVHLHLLGTHGPVYAPTSQAFRAGPSMSAEEAKRANAIRDFDAYVRELVESLEENGRADNTIIVLTTDHSHLFEVAKRIPLAFLIPGEEGRRIPENTQLLDVAPTLLAVAGIEPPDWMNGVPLLDQAPAADRPVHSSNIYIHEGARLRKIANGIRKVVAPPFYRFSDLNMVVGDQSWTLSLIDNSLTREIVESHTAPLADEQLPTDEEARAMLEARAREHGLPLTQPAEL